jgi:hypothetical protein
MAGGSRIDHRSLTSVPQRWVKTGGRFVKHARYDWLLRAEGRLTRHVFGAMRRRIWALPPPAGSPNGWRESTPSKEEERMERCRRTRSEEEP